MPKLTLPALPSEGEDFIVNKSQSSVSEPYTASTYASLDLDDLDSGIMSTLNGRLSYENLDSSLEIKDYHIQPEQVSLASSDSMLSSSTIYGTGVPSVGEDENYFTLPGCSVRWYQPFDTSVSLMQWSFFLSYNVWRGVYRDMEGQLHTRGVSSLIKLRCVLDGSEVAGSGRTLGHNMFHPISPYAVDMPNQTGPGINGQHQLALIDFTRYDETESPAYFPGSGTGGTTYIGTLGKNTRSGPRAQDPQSYDPPAPPGSIEWVAPGRRGGNPRYVASETHTATQFDLHHSAALSKGYHEISVEALIMQPDGAGVYLQNVGKPTSGLVQGRGYFNLVGKLSLGIRNARVLNLL
jgi:hypothetical protein